MIHALLPYCREFRISSDSGDESPATGSYSARFTFIVAKLLLRTCLEFQYFISNRITIFIASAIRSKAALLKNMENVNLSNFFAYDTISLKFVRYTNLVLI